jgi:hypothetical protein
MCGVHIHRCFIPVDGVEERRIDWSSEARPLSMLGQKTLDQGKTRNVTF